MKNSLLLFVCFMCSSGFGETRRITLGEAVQLAKSQNHGLKAARYRVEQNVHRVRAARADFFPRLANEANLWQVADLNRLEIPRGVFGVFKDLGPIPSTPITMLQGGNNLFFTYTTLGQPLTQMFKIREGYRVAQAETRQSEAELRKGENDLALGVEQLYFGLLIAQRQRRAVELRIQAAEARLQESRQAVETGNVLEVAAIGGRAAVLESRHALLAVDDQIADFTVELNDLIGLPLDTRLELAPVAVAEPAMPALAEYERAALEGNPEVRAAQSLVEKAHSGLRAARTEYIPELSAFARHAYQNSVPFLPRNNGVFGFTMNWNLFDFGKRHQTVAERQAALSAAEENLQRLRGRTLVDVEKSYRKLERSRQMIEVAREALALRRESARISSDHLEAGVIAPAAFAEASAALASAEADVLRAELGHRLARAELERAAGML